MKKEKMEAVVSRHRNKQQWQTLVRVLAVCVVFFTTYLLVMPAITMEGDPICGFCFSFF